MEAPKKIGSNKNQNYNVIEKKEEEKKKEKIMVPLPEDFDLQAYISPYVGHTKILRLIFIAEHCKDLEKEAYKLALEELKKTLNSTLYRALVEKVGADIGVTLDVSWIEGVDRKAAQTQEKLELELNQSKQSLQKEAIRKGHNELGQLHYDRGDLNSALRCYVRTRDYCTNPKHIIEMCLNIIRVSIEMGNYSHVVNYVTKGEQTSENTNDKVVAAKLRVCSGLAHLDGKKYKLAARKFLETTVDIGETFNDVILSGDIAVYAGLTALASFDRSELKRKVIDNIGFAPFFELAVDIRELIYDFYSSNYASCFKRLAKLKNLLLLDIHLHDHVEFIYQKIRSKALIQYFSPFSSIDLNTMASAFNTNVAGLEKELSKLIMEDSISARIDSHNKRLYARKTDQRSVTFEKTLKVGDEYQVNAKSMLLRLNLLRNDLSVRPPRRGGDEGGKEFSRKGTFPSVVASFTRNF